MGSKYSGQCLCGQIRYTVDVEPAFAGNCHCKDCQRASGSAYIPALIFPESSVKVIGEATYFESQADSGNLHRRGFCSTCGSRLFAKFSNLPGMFGIAAGTLDVSACYSPKVDFFAASAAVWDYMDPSLPKKQGAPRS